MGATNSTRELVYVAEASGGAWSAAMKAREAMNSLDGIAELHMSGARAVFQIEEGADVDEDTLSDAFAEAGMKLERFERIDRQRANGIYLIDSGITWAVTAGEVRAALLEQTGVIDVYFEDEIEILVLDSADFPVDAVKEILTSREIAFTAIEATSL
jgi:hypothetical protein